MALAQAGEDLGARYHIGVTRSSDSDFCGVGRPSVGGYMQPRHLELLDYYRRAGVLNGDRRIGCVGHFTAVVWSTRRVNLLGGG